MKKYFFIPLLAVFLHGCSSSGVMTPSSPPPSISSLESNDVSYEGSLPCKNCDAIKLSIDLYPDTASFSLNSSYVNHPQNEPDEDYEGRWTVLRGTSSDPNAIVYKLTPSSDGQEYFFLRLNKNQLELISPQREKFQRGDELRVNRSTAEDSNKNTSDDPRDELVDAFLKETGVGYIILTAGENDYVDTVKESINDRLKDPSSASYKNVTVKGEGDKKYVCGELNAKNSFGGYTGYKRFIANFSSYHPLGETAGDILYPRLCR